MQYPHAIKNAVQSLTGLPGIGEKTALRLSLQMMKWDQDKILRFSEAIEELANIRYCIECGLFSENSICHICDHPFRKDAHTICIVENVNDLMAIEKSGEYKGLYHILGGVLNPLSGIGPNQLKLDKLKERVEAKNILNLILAVNPSVEGDATCTYIKHIFQERNINVERIGFGVPIGGTLEYLDPMTISKALENRTMIL